MKEHLFFLGMAGFAMGGLALAAQNRGYTVSGLDETAGPPMSDWLDDHQLTWTRQYHPNLLDGVTEIVISGQHGSDTHPVIVAARDRGIKISSFAELFGRLTQDKHVVAVSGTHGKSTTTSLITWLLQSAGQQPDYLIGIRPFNFEASSRLEGSPTVVVEADEYKSSVLDNRPKFNYYHPDTLVITSIEHDHPDLYPDLAAVEAAFRQLVVGLPAHGKLVVWAESPTVMKAAQAASCPVVTYGLEKGDYVARDVAFLATGIEFDVETADGVLGRFAVPLYGRHNVLNALAAVAVVLAEGVPFTDILKGGASFKGVFRRFNLVSPIDSPVVVIDDYAHHPTEVATNVEAAKLHFPHHRLVAVFRPHTYSRVKALLPDFQQAFKKADHVYITEIESAREAAHERTVSGRDIAAGIPGHKATFEPNRAKLVATLTEHARPDDVVLCMSVGIYEGLAMELGDKLSKISHQ